MYLGFHGEDEARVKWLTGQIRQCLEIATEYLASVTNPNRRAELRQQLEELESRLGKPDTGVQG
jgi:hypothetical protein